AEIARSQVWQWVRHAVRLSSGERVEPEMVRQVAKQEVERLGRELGEEGFATYRVREAQALFDEVALGDEFVEFLTLPAYEVLESS
ncbi:MAG: malate synthase A, partial [Acidimicrobiia bacterium]